MRICDDSMSLLVGSDVSLGALKAISDSIENNGVEQMPGYCCMDTAVTSEFWGYDVSLHH